MHKATLLPAIVVLAVVIGGLLYLYGGSAFRPSNVVTTQQPTQTGTADTHVIARGLEAGGIDQRVNYRITEPSQFELLWETIYGNTVTSAPSIDFTRSEVLAVFDGSHSTGGYDVRVDSIKEVDGRRVITIIRIEPGESCAVTTGPTSPFVLVQVPKSSLPITHVQNTEIKACR